MSLADAIINRLCFVLQQTQGKITHSIEVVTEIDNSIQMVQNNYSIIEMVLSGENDNVTSLCNTINECKVYLRGVVSDVLEMGKNHCCGLQVLPHRCNTYSEAKKKFQR